MVVKNQFQAACYATFLLFKSFHLPAFCKGLSIWVKESNKTKRRNVRLCLVFYWTIITIIAGVTAASFWMATLIDNHMAAYWFMPYPAFLMILSFALFRLLDGLSRNSQFEEQTNTNNQQQRCSIHDPQQTSPQTPEMSKVQQKKKCKCFGQETLETKAKLN